MQEYHLESNPMDQQIDINDFWLEPEQVLGQQENLDSDYFSNQDSLLPSDLQFFDASPNTILSSLELNESEVVDESLFMMPSAIPEFDYKLEPQNLLPQKRPANLFANPAAVKKIKPELNKRDRRLEANKRSAQASRDRKKHMKEELEQKVEELSQEKHQIDSEISRLKTENEVMKRELISLHEMIEHSPLLSKMMERTQTQSLYNVARTEPASTTSASAAQWYTIIAMHMYLQHFNASNQNTQNESAALVA